MQLDDNDWFIMYTDGFIETQDAESQEFGEEGLIRVLKENKGENAQHMVGIIFNRVMNFSHSSSQEDDMTIIGIKALPGK